MAGQIAGRDIPGTIADGKVLVSNATGGWDPATPGGGSTPTGTGFRHVTAGVEDSVAVEIFSGLAKITVGTTAPVGPAAGDLWIDSN